MCSCKILRNIWGCSLKLLSVFSMELQGRKPKTITVAIPKVIASIYKNLKDICESVLCIYHKWLCTLFRCASLWDRALSPINISLISCLGGPLFLSMTSSPSQASERRWFQLGQFPQHTGGCFPAMVHRCPQWGGVRHPRVVQLIWSKPSITTWFCGQQSLLQHECSSHPVPKA